MPLRKSIITERVEDLCNQTQEPKDLAFTKFAFSTIKGTDYDDLQPEDIVDGGSDKQIDSITIEEDSNNQSARITIIQAKFSESFSSNIVTLLRNGLDWVFSKPKSEYEKLSNPRFVEKIREARSILNNLGPSNISVYVYFVTLGNDENLSDEFLAELSETISKYNNGTFSEFKTEAIGPRKLVTLLNVHERKNKSISYDLPIVYDRNQPSYIEYQSEGLKGCICTAKAQSLAAMIDKSNEDSIFDLNLRKYYGISKGSVNPDIANSASNTDEAYRFWFYNNGITIVCDRYDVVPDPDTTHLKLENIQIVNGCQTSMTLSTLYREGKLSPEAEVLVKIFKTQDKEFLNRIVLTTNNQNSINSRDLKSNDTVQVDYQRAFMEKFGLRYERKPREYGNLPRAEARAVISNEKLAQAYLAIVKKRPTIARTQKYKIWDSPLYNQLFPNSDISNHYLSYLIYDYCLKQKGESLKRFSDSPVEYSIVTYGVFHLSRVVAFKFTKTENWSDKKVINERIHEVLIQPQVLNSHYLESVQFIKELFSSKGSEIEKENINNAFKASHIEHMINIRLNPNNEKTNPTLKLDELPLLFD